MASPRWSRKSPLVSTVVTLAFFSALVSAQNNDDDDDDPPPPPQRTTTSPRQTTTSSRQTSASSSNAPVPTITGRPGGGGPGGPLPGLPSLTGGGAIFTHAPPAVPPVANAPFMQRSSLPDGTVFIAVGAILGTFALAVLLWRGIVACLLHRSVERAALAQHVANDKAASFPAPPGPFYKYTDRDSSPSLAAIPPARGVRRTNRGPIPSSTPSQTNLFFSPTAAGSSGGAAGRDSRWLPSGFYAAGASPSPVNGHGHSISLTNLRPESRGNYSRNTMREPSPEDSPQFGARRDLSSTSLNLNRPPSGRAPSAYLDDLLDENPELFPPAQMPPPAAAGPRHGHTPSHSSQGRY